MPKKGSDRGDAAKKILERLRKGPATPKQLQDDLGLVHGTVFYNLRKDSFLFKFDLIEQLEDGKYATKGYSSEEARIRESHDSLRGKLLRNPSSEELAGLIQETPAVTKALLFKYIPGYREPTKEEIASSERALCKVIVWGSSNLPSKKEFFEKGVAKVVVEGIDQEILNEILNYKPTISLDDAKKYITEFPEMKADITEIDEGYKIIYKVKWSDEAKRILNAIDNWNKVAEIRIPLRFEDEESKYPFCGFNAWEDYYHAKELAEIYVPSQRIIDGLLEIVGLSHLQCEILLTLKQFCNNALQVGQLDEKNKEKIVLRLFGIVFAMDIPDLREYRKHNPDRGEYVEGCNVSKERGIAFDIIEMLDIRTTPVIDIAMKFVNDCLFIYEYDTSGVHKVGKWVAKDPVLKADLVKTRNLLMNPPNIEFASFYKSFLSIIL